MRIPFASRPVGRSGTRKGRAARFTLKPKYRRQLFDTAYPIVYDGDMQEMAQPETRNFAANLAALCAEHGEVQRIATKADITRVYLSKIIHGRATPTIEVASKIAEALGLPLGELLKSPRQFKKILSAAS